MASPSEFSLKCKTGHRDHHDAHDIGIRFLAIYTHVIIFSLVVPRYPLALHKKLLLIVDTNRKVPKCIVGALPR